MPAKMVLGIAYTSRDEEEVQKWKEEVQGSLCGIRNCYESVIPERILSSRPGSLAVTCTKVVEA
ncbi:MAG: hypothetical protein ACLVJ2_08865 [[Ruminococcus] lactaris]|uniref:hypothetical protein n=1 Tax=[Ruminococcus] lactaris TaxID=46228 RepID=UPI00399B8A50